MKLRILLMIFILSGIFCSASPFSKYKKTGRKDKGREQKEEKAAISKLSTDQIRALASINIADSETVIKKIIPMLTDRPWKEYRFFYSEQVVMTPLKNFTEEKIVEVLEYYNTDLTEWQMRSFKDHGTILDLVMVITAAKREGLETEKAWHCMEVLLYDFIQDKEEDLSNYQADLINKIYKRTKYRRRHFEDIEHLLQMHQKGFRNAVYFSLYERALDAFIDQEVKLINSCYGKPIGHIVEAGWAEHFIGVEVLPLENGQYGIYVANAGDGSKRYHLEGGSLLEDPRHLYFTVNEYVVYNEEELRDVLVGFIEMFYEYGMDNASDHFYSLFEGKTQIINPGVPLRSLQYIGNCAVRNQEELIFRVLQRCGEVDLANQLQDYFIEYYQQQVGNLYPALRDHIEAQKEMIKQCLVKPSIEPIEPSEVLEIIAGKPNDTEEEPAC
jgi:hypothetical protein